jgi:hypothetical protein
MSLALAVQARNIKSVMESRPDPLRNYTRSVRWLYFS